VGTWKASLVAVFLVGGRTSCALETLLEVSFEALRSLLERGTPVGLVVWNPSLRVVQREQPTCCTMSCFKTSKMRWVLDISVCCGRVQ
jgi:hypothetical protein